MKISIMAAMSTNRAIGNKNRLPWGTMPADWRNLYTVTEGKIMIMGRKTYDAPDRVWSDSGNIVISHHKDMVLDPSFIKADSLDHALDLVKLVDEVFIIGGAEIFKQALPLAHTIHLTLIHGVFEGDAFFPEIDESRFKLAGRKDFKKDAENPYDYSFLVYRKRSNVSPRMLAAQL